MNLHLSRFTSSKDGIFSELYTEDGLQIAVTLEHAYLVDPNGLYQPKIPDGTFVCVRGMHRLVGMTAPFETFEITGVSGHTNLLFHAGNFNRDSEGCILLGEQIRANMITNSREAFAAFMKLQDGVDSFTLQVY